MFSLNFGMENKTPTFLGNVYYEIVKQLKNIDFFLSITVLSLLGSG